LAYFTNIWNIFGFMINFMVIRYIFPHFGMLHEEKSGNPARDQGDQMFFLGKY
jgi:hypothetical protein